MTGLKAAKIIDTGSAMGVACRKLHAGEAVDKNLFRPSKSIWPKGAQGLSLTVAFFLFNAEHFNVFGNKNVIRLFSDTLWSRPAELNLTSIIIAWIGFFALMLLFKQKR